MEPITREQLIEFGMKINVADDKFIYPMKKNLGRAREDEDDEDSEVISLDLVITREYNKPQLAIVCPGCTLFLDGVQSIEDLKVIERCISSFEPSY